MILYFSYCSTVVKTNKIESQAQSQQVSVWLTYVNKKKRYNDTIIYYTVAQTDYVGKNYITQSPPEDFYIQLSVRLNHCLQHLLSTRDYP